MTQQELIDAYFAGEIPWAEVMERWPLTCLVAPSADCPGEEGRCCGARATAVVGAQ